MKNWRSFYNNSVNKCLNEFITQRVPQLKEEVEWKSLTKMYGNNKKFGFCRDNCSERCDHTNEVLDQPKNK